MRRRIVVIARVLVSIALLGYLLMGIDLAKLAGVWRGIVLPFVGLALALQLAGILISSLKWWLLLRARGERVPYGWTVRTYLIGQFFSNFLPTMVGGDAVRVYQLSRRIGRLSTAFASVFVERLTGFLALTLIAWTALTLNIRTLDDAPPLLWSAVACLLLASGVLVLVLMVPVLPRLLGGIHVPNILDWRGKLDRAAQMLSRYARERGTLAVVMALSFGYQLTWIATNSTAARALDLDIPFDFVALMVPISDIVGLVPIFLNNLGAREGTFVVLLGHVGMPVEPALALAFLILLVRLGVSLLGGVIYLLDGLSGTHSTLVEDVQAIQHAPPPISLKERP